MSVRLIGVMIDGKQTVHVPCAFGAYDTLCGIDADDPKIGHGGTFEPHETKFVSCQTCWIIWKGIKDFGLREKDFAPSIRK